VKESHHHHWPCPILLQEPELNLENILEIIIFGKLKQNVRPDKPAKKRYKLLEKTHKIVFLLFIVTYVKDW
jgi:hypothetical protein